MNRRHFLLYSVLFTAGCSTAPVIDSAPTTLPDPLTFAVTDVEGLDELEKDYEPFRAALAEALGTNVIFFPVNGHFAAASALRSGELLLAWAGPSEYVAIEARSQARPLVALNRPNYYTTISVRAGSGITTLSELKGKTIDMWKVGSNTAHLGGVKLLLDAGLDPKADVRVTMSEKDDLAILTDGQADAWSRPIHKYEQALQAAGANPEDYPIIAQGNNFPGDVFVASSQLDWPAVTLIESRLLENQEALLQGIQATASLAKKFRAATFAAADDADYNLIRDVYKALGSQEYF